MLRQHDSPRYPRAARRSPHEARLATRPARFCVRMGAHAGHAPRSDRVLRGPQRAITATWLRFGLGPSRSFSSHPDQIHEVLVLQARCFKKPGRIRQVFGRFQGDGLFVSEGEHWARQRRLLQTAFHPSRLRTYASAIAECTAEMVDNWVRHADVDFQAEMMRLALVVVTRALFSTSSDDMADRLAEAVGAIERWSIRELTRAVCVPSWVPLLGQAETRRAINLVNSVMERMIDQRSRPAGSHDDLLDRLLAAGNSGSGVHRMTRRQIRDELVTLLFAGHDTTGVAMTWAGWLLAVHGDIQERLSAEVRDVLGTRIPDFDDLPRLRSVEMAFKEAMRLISAGLLFLARGGEPGRNRGLHDAAGHAGLSQSLSDSARPSMVSGPDRLRPRAIHG